MLADVGCDMFSCKEATVRSCWGHAGGASRRMHDPGAATQEAAKDHCQLDCFTRLSAKHELEDAPTPPKHQNDSQWTLSFRIEAIIFGTLEV